MANIQTKARPPMKIVAGSLIRLSHPGVATPGDANAMLKNIPTPSNTATPMSPYEKASAKNISQPDRYPTLGWMTLETVT